MNKLNNIEKKNPFTVPDDYFAKFNAEITSRLPEKEIRKIPLWRTPRAWIYAAAMIAGVYLCVQVVTKNKSTDSQSVDTSSPWVKTAKSSDTYWSNVSISEDEFYLYLEDRLVDDGYYNYLYDELYHQAQNM